jgi:hypothetical protein
MLTQIAKMIGYEPCDLGGFEGCKKYTELLFFE